MSGEITPDKIFAFFPLVANFADQVTDVFDKDPLHDDKRLQLIEAIRAAHALASKISPEAARIPTRAFTKIVGGVWDITEGALMIAKAMEKDG